MKIDELLLSFLQQLIISNKLETFFKDRPLVICIKHYKDSYYIHLDEEDALLKKADEVEKIDLVIEGNEKAIFALINGKERLQRLQKRGDLKVEGTYAVILKAETLFYLVRCDCCTLKLPD